MPLNSSGTAGAAWIALAPHDAAHGIWRFCSGTGNVTFDGTPASAAPRMGGSALHVIAPLSRCIVMAADLPPLHGAKLQQALTGVLGDRLTGGGTQHYAAAPLADGRVREAAACDAAWLRHCLNTLTTSGLRVARVVPEASLLPKGAAWWGQLQTQTDQPATWLIRTQDGEAVRATPSLLDAVLPPPDDPARLAWQWFADPASAAPPSSGPDKAAALSVTAFMQRATASGWDLRQGAYAPDDAAGRFIKGSAATLAQRSGRLAIGAVLALLVVNVVGLNLYAMKQQREITARHAEMERIVTQALPGAPRLLEPAVQLEAAWQRTQGSANGGAAQLLGLFAQTGSAQALTSLDVSASALRAGFADGAALERSAAACLAAPLREPLQRAGVRCVRDGATLLLDFTRDAVPIKG